MNDTINTFPVGKQILGRVLHTKGEPIDKKGPHTNGQRKPILKPASGIIETETNEEKVPIDQILETGIKVLDLLAPLPRKGVVGIFGNAGVGKLVVTEELMHNFITMHDGYIVCLSMGESTYEVSELMDLIREGELEDKVVMLYEQMTDSLEVRLNMIYAGFTIARHYKEQGHMALVVIDKNITANREQAPIIIGELRRILKEQEITVILLQTEEDSKLFQIGESLDELDCQIVLTRKMADQSLWPAIDRLLSNSRLLNSSVVGDEHVQVAQNVRELLLHYAKFQTLEQQERSDADSQLLGRTQRIQKFFTQPFFVAEAYTEIPGEYVKVEVTVKDLKELLEGRYDNLSEQAFYFVGGIDEAVAKSHTNLS
jgi:F-type H+/Na+-transporting ATPase subunit beta